MSSTRRALIFLFTERYASLGIQFVSSLIVARILGPHEVGLFSIAFAVTQIIGTVRDFGVPQYIVQEKELTDARVRAAQTVSIIISWGLGLLLASVSGPAATFYDDMHVQQLILLLSLNFILLPFGQVSMGFLQKSFQFQKVMAIGVASALVSAVCVVTLAVMGYGAMSMAMANIAGSAVTVAGAMIFRPKAAPFGLGLTDAGRVFSFGFQVTLIHALYAVGSRAPSLMIAKLLSFAAAGIYERASSLVEVFNTSVMQAVWKITLPLFSRDSHDIVAVRESYLKVTAYLTGIGFPFFALLGVLAPSIVYVLLGPKWMEAATILSFLSISGAIGLCTATAQNLFTALGRISTVPRLVASVYATLLPLIAVSAPFGLKAVGAAVVFSTVFGAALTLYLLRKEIPLRDMFRVLNRSAIVALPVLAISLVVRSSISESPTLTVFMVLVATGVVSAATWLVGLRLVGHPLHHEVDNVIALIRR